MLEKKTSVNTRGGMQNENYSMQFMHNLNSINSVMEQNKMFNDLNIQRQDTTINNFNSLKYKSYNF